MTTNYSTDEDGFPCDVQVPGKIRQAVREGRMPLTLAMQKIRPKAAVR